MRSRQGGYESIKDASGLRPPLPAPARPSPGISERHDCRFGEVIHIPSGHECPTPHGALAVREGTVWRCDTCGLTWVAYRLSLCGEMFARWRREGRIARWRRNRKELQDA